MDKRSKRRHEAELVHLRDWTLAVMRFTGGAGFPGALDMEEKIIRDAFERKDLRGLRTIAGDKREMIRLAPSEERERLDRFLRSEFGRGIDGMERDDAAQIRRILACGRIGDEDEARLLMAREGDLSADGPDRDERAAINRLLAKYQADGR